MKVAKLVTVRLTVRVVVESDASEEQILDAVKPRLHDKVNTELFESVEEIEDDTELPYDPQME